MQFTEREFNQCKNAARALLARDNPPVAEVVIGLIEMAFKLGREEAQHDAAKVLCVPDR